MPGFNVSTGARQLIQQPIEQHQHQLIRRSTRHLSVEVDCAVVVIAVIHFSDHPNMLKVCSIAAITCGSTGAMKARKDNLNNLLQRVDEKYEDLEIKYQNHYQRYLKQYTQLAQVMAAMEQTFSMFG